MSNQIVIPHNCIYWYDIESYINFFSICIERETDNARWQFEISDWYHQGQELYHLLMQIKASGGRMGGFNNYGFDYPMLHLLMQQQGMIDAATLKHKCNHIIQSGNSGDRFSNIIWDRDQFVPQLDLMKIHHFDNVAKMTSLKLLEFNMRMGDIVELPYPPNHVLTLPESREVLTYNWHDVKATRKLGDRTKNAIAFRDKLTEKYGRNFTNHNDTKIGKDYFIMRLEEAGVKTGKNIQSPRDMINVNDIIFPYVKFETPEFQAVLDQLRNTVITETKGALDIQVDFHGIVYKFGTGGLHAATDNRIYTSTDELLVEMRDVTSYYPSLAIKNRLYPEHLSEIFCDIYEDMFLQRTDTKATMAKIKKRLGEIEKEMRKFHPNSDKYKELDDEQGMLKLALNGTYGDSNNVHSPFYDPKFTMSITVNGQLLLCMLCEQLVKVPGLEMINVNTDGVGFIYPREYKSHIDAVCEWWEQTTMLNLETDEFTKFIQRDVNNYIGVQDGKVKRKGAYEYKIGLHQNHSSLVIQKAVEAYFMYDQDISEFIHNHDDVYDFFLRTKVPKSSHLLCGDEQVQNVSRYYVSETGGALTKVMPPTGKLIEKWHTAAHWKHRDNGKHANAPKAPSGKYDLCPAPSELPPDRRMSIQKGYLVTICNSVSGHEFNDINYDYYIAEARKLVDELM